jgi:hypothetical protein
MGMEIVTKSLNRLRPAHIGQIGGSKVAALSAELTDFCKEIELQFIDLAGNAYIEAPGFYVFVKGQKGDINQMESLNKHSVSAVTDNKKFRHRKWRRKK